MRPRDTVSSLLLSLWFVVVTTATACAADRQAPVRVFVLAGQSNMEGHGRIAEDESRNGGRGSLAFVVRQPDASPRFRRLIDDSKAWVARDDVWISFGERHGPLTVGYGANERLIGPELGFGSVVGDAIDDPVLLVKCAWGGKSLAVDFRPPSAGPIPYSLGDKADAAVASDPTIVGRYFRQTVAETKSALSKVAELLPDGSGREVIVSGVFWHQGWNDRINDRFNAEYESNLVHFINDLRREFRSPALPFVIAETGMTGPEEKHPRALSLMKAQAAVAERPEFQGNVAFVGTKAFWRPAEQSPSAQGYHWNSNAETYCLIGEAAGHGMNGLLAAARANFQKGEMSGYLIVPNDKVAADYDAGFSMYVAAWPLLKRYPGPRFQSGLFGTWMFAQWDHRPEGKLYSDIEGGLGWWRDTRFATETPKFIMGGVAPNFVEWANGPGAGKGRDWNKPAGHYGVAQLSPWLLWPPDGLNLKQGVCGQLFGYGYLPLPLISAKTTTQEKPVPTGENCWTLFLNTANFKGPVAFFTPFFWSRASANEPRLAGQLLDSRPSDPNRHLQMETQYIPACQAVDSRGVAYARIAPTVFPGSAIRGTPLVHQITSYRRQALWDGVKRWFEGGRAADGVVDAQAAVVHKLTRKGNATWRIYADGTPKEERSVVDWESITTPVLADSHTLEYRWNAEHTSFTDDGRVELPQYFRKETAADGKRTVWRPVSEAEVPDDIGLKQVTMPRARRGDSQPYVTPDDPTSCWKSPGPAAGPFQARPGDGSALTYYWYRFADQPALLNADLSPEEREVVQRRVEMIHRAWRKDGEYLPPPVRGSLAELDPALIVTPPAGLEVGYVPIVTRQELAPTNN